MWKFFTFRTISAIIDRIENVVITLMTILFLYKNPISLNKFITLTKDKISPNFTFSVNFYSNLIINCCYDISVL